MIKKILLLLIFLVYGLNIDSQATTGLCDTITPTFNVNLTGNPSGTFVSNPPVSRLGNCCGTTAPDKCIQFIITLDPAAAGIRFNIASGAVPPGALFYQIGCGPQTQVGDVICLSGPGPHILTFCKPGNNQNTYSIESIPFPYSSNPDTVVQGCFTPLAINGVVVDSSIIWTSIFPGPAGTYDSLLSCTVGCKTVSFTPDTNSPPYIDYLVCGTPEAPCLATSQFCDTVRVHVIQQFEVSAPSPVYYCSSSGGIQLNGSVTGGVPPYTYRWTDGPNGTGTQISNTTSAFASAPGTYSFAVRDNSYSFCPIEKIVNVTVIEKFPAVVDAGDDLFVCPSSTSVTLNGSITGGTTVQWIGGNGVFSPNRQTLTATYTLTPTEVANGGVTLTLQSTGDTICPSSADIVDLIITPPLQANIIGPTNICFGSTANLSVNASGGTLPYTYQWSSGETTQNIGPKLPGMYIVTVTDNSASPCSAKDTIFVVEDPPLNVTIPNSIVTCDTFALVKAVVSGGRPNYTYLWSNLQTTDSIYAYSGRYWVTVTDSLGCTAVDSCQVQASNSTMLVNVDVPPGTCIGDSSFISADVIGNSGPYTATWSNSSIGDSVFVPRGTYCVTIVDSNGCIATACNTLVTDSVKFDVYPVHINCFGVSNGAAHTVVTGGFPQFSYQWSGNGNTDTTSSSSGLSAGNYNITVTDSLGCTLTKNVTITQPTQIQLNVTKTDASCNSLCDGIATVTVSGGVGPYSVYWPILGVTGNTVSNLCAQTYSIIVTDDNGCSTVGSVVIGQPAPISVVFNTIPSNCKKADGSLSVNTSGGTAGYTYNWLPGGQTTPAISGLVSGTYCVEVTDSRGCRKSFCDSIGDIPGVSTSVTSSAPITCLGRCDGSISTFSSGGSPPYTYLWSNSMGVPNITNLCTGVYSLLTIDANGCQDTTTGYVGYPLPVNVSFSIPDFICDSGNIAYAYGSGGVGGPYTFFWQPDSVFADSLKVFVPKSPYYVRAYDANGCESDSVRINLIPYSPITSSLLLLPNDSICPGDSVVLAALAAGGNSASYTYYWTPSGDTGQSVIVYPASSGFQVVTITDACATDKKDSVYVNVLPTPYIDPKSNIYQGCAPLCVNFSNSNTIYDICRWDPGDGSGTIDSCLAQHCYNTGGIYYPTLTVVDQFGCTNTDSTQFAVEVFNNPGANFSYSIRDVDLYIHKEVVFTDISPFYGTNEWYFVREGDTIFQFFNEENVKVNFQISGEYNVWLIVTDNNGCTDTIMKTVVVKDLEFIYVPNTFTPNGNGDNEKFKPSIVGFYDYETYKFMVFNRWGQLIFSSNNHNEAWDGTYKGEMSKEDTYVWKLEIRLLYEDRKEEYIGHVNLLK